MSLKNLIENKDKLDYKALTTSLINEFGITDAITWEAVIPTNVQQNLFGGETLRLFSDHPNFAAQKDIRTILLKKGQTSQLLILFAKLKDEKLSKQNIEKVTKKGNLFYAHIKELRILNVADEGTSPEYETKTQDLTFELLNNGGNYEISRYYHTNPTSIANLKYEGFVANFLQQMPNEVGEAKQR